MYKAIFKNFSMHKKAMQNNTVTSYIAIEKNNNKEPIEEEE
jgi:hypothetical protein